MKAQFLTTITLLALTLACCKKPAPEPKQEVFTCRVDGTFFTYDINTKGTFGPVDNLKAKYDVTWGGFYINASDYYQRDIQINLSTPFPNKDTFLLKEDAGGAAFASYTSLSGAFTSDEHGGQVVFTNTKDGWVDGTFYFDVLLKGKVVHITDGKFSIKL
jgi:hypothetical protein